jgi:hypothetical protein
MDNTNRPKSDVEQLTGIISQFDESVVKETMLSMGLIKDSGPTFNISTAAPRPEIAFSTLGRFSFLPLAPVLGAAPVFLNAGDASVDELIELLKKFLKNPAEVVTGPRSTGNRVATVKEVKERCGGDKSCDLKEAEMQFTFNEFVGVDNLSVVVTITWKYDCCNVYEADASYTITNAPAEDTSVIITEKYTIPETDPVELKPCTPCTPKCLRTQVSIFELVQERAQIFPSTKRKVDVDVTLCPSSNGRPKVFDNTKSSPNESEYTLKRTKDPTPRNPPAIGGGE